MGKKKKPFIDKKKAVTFTLVHRSQQDPLIADETAPPRVLSHVPGKADSKEQEPKAKKKRVEEQIKCGIYFDDDYDYLQHLKFRGADEGEEVERFVWEKIPSSSQNSGADRRWDERIQKLNLPSEVFASKAEEPIGMLNKAAPHPGPHPEWDPDVVAALDDDFDFDDPENVLEDDFVVKALASDSEDVERSEDEDDSEESKDFNSDEAEDEVRSLPEPDSEDEKQTRFTEYSMSSSVMRRNEQLALLDDRFEEFYSTYGDLELGALDGEEIEGILKPDSAVVMMLAKEFENRTKKEALVIAERKKTENVIEESDDEMEEKELVEIPVKPEWDCQSILSTYSNIYNHPKLIEEPKSKRIQIGKRGIPVEETGGGLTRKALAQFDRETGELTGDRKRDEMTLISQLSKFSFRSKTETPEERKRRKQTLKLLRRERRVEKKMNADLFKEEKKKAEKVEAGKAKHQLVQMV
ncbi:unnamed protein product [Cyprideis torosa]|uniref:Protein LTV1 homolog n=1 Tax=Cyprideis torosa TaxID=163714 RepID=A0A7R8W0Y4_9CRUS|nr:unnamed protein product [Cyprideis torosa]CAG0880294.1 unnamed protein product [Cyprideis torosa]